jgi:hypothetical protein
MDTRGFSAPEVARELGISLPRVHRLLDTHGVPRAGRGVVRTVSLKSLERMRDKVGAVPAAGAGLDRVQTLVLSAVARASLGLESQRAVARAAGVSPTATGRALAALRRRGLVGQVDRKVVRGTGRTLTFWTARSRGRDWTPEVQHAVKTTVLPAKAPSRPARRVPSRFAHLFWNADLANLDLENDGA